VARYCHALRFTNSCLGKVTNGRSAHIVGGYNFQACVFETGLKRLSKDFIGLPLRERQKGTPALASLAGLAPSFVKQSIDDKQPSP
jgi:hypothetical protein